MRKKYLVPQAKLFQIKAEEKVACCCTKPVKSTLPGNCFCSCSTQGS